MKFAHVLSDYADTTSIWNVRRSKKGRLWKTCETRAQLIDASLRAWIHHRKALIHFKCRRTTEPKTAKINIKLIWLASALSPPCPRRRRCCSFRFAFNVLFSCLFVWVFSSLPSPWKYLTAWVLVTPCQVWRGGAVSWAVIACARNSQAVVCAYAASMCD